MYYSRDRWDFDWREFLTGVLFLIAGIFVFLHPDAGLVTMALLFAVIAVMHGITAIAGFFRLRQYLPRASWLVLVAGILDVVLGLLFLFNVPAGIVGITMLFSIWFMVDTIANLATVSHLRALGVGWFALSLILDVLSLVFAVLMFMQPVVAAVSFAMLVGIYLCLFGINAIVIAFARWRG